MRRAGCLCDLLLSEAELESPLPQMRGDRADLTKGADTLVFSARGAVGLAATQRDYSPPLRRSDQQGLWGARAI